MRSIARPLRLTARAVRPSPNLHGPDSQLARIRLQRHLPPRQVFGSLHQAPLPRARLYSSNPDRPTQPSSSKAEESKSESETPSSAGPEATSPENPTATKPSDTPAADPEHELPSATDSRRPPMTERFSSFMDNLQARWVAGLQTFNSITGYSAIEAITANNNKLERALATARTRMSSAHQHYKDVSARQVSTQREMVSLLARKASWTQSDKTQFAELLDADYKLEREVADASRAVEEAEGEEQRLISEWVAGMSKQYYEHQVYSDRIRRASTWGTWGLMGFNVLLFLMIQFVAEPWKRARLLNSMEEREKRLLATVENRLDGGFAEVRGELRVALDALQPTEEDGEVVVAAGTRLAEERARSWREFLQEPRLWKGPLLEFYHRISADITVKDVVSMTLQGAMIFLLLRN